MVLRSSVWVGYFMVPSGFKNDARNLRGEGFWKFELGDRFLNFFCEPRMRKIK